MCDPPIVDSKIGFWDGFSRNKHIGAIIIPIFVLSIGFEIFKYKYSTPKAIKDFEILKQEDDKDDPNDELDKIDQII